MSAHTIVPTVSRTEAYGMPHASVVRRTIALALSAVALVLVLAGGFLPWVSVFGGLTRLNGFSLDGGVLAFVVLAVVAMLFVQVRHGGARILRPIAVTGALAVIADSVYSAWRIADYARTPGPTGLLTQPSPGVGPYVFAAAGAALLVAAVVAPAAGNRLGLRMTLRLSLATLLLGAAVIHLILVPEHLGISTVLGLGFLAAGLAQLALAVAVLAAPDRLQPVVMQAVIVVTVALIIIYAYAVLVGLPIEAGHADDDAGLRIGVGEAVDLKGGIDFLAEIATVGIAAFLALSGGRSLRHDE